MDDSGFENFISDPKGELSIALTVNFIWINASEVFRYFAFVMPMMREAFPALADVAPMSLAVFLSWAVWDTILVISVSLIAWLSLSKLGLGWRSVLVTATGIWAAIFVILWLGLWNMNLATGPIVLIALSLAWIEMIVATTIVRWAILRRGRQV